MDLEINNYIDFNKLFNDLFKENEDELIEYQYEAEHFGKILQFNYIAKEKFDLVLDECELDGSTITFVYEHDFNDANESNNQSTTASYVIMYDRILDEFSECYYEQG
jgi:hypothetical protein